MSVYGMKGNGGFITKKLEIKDKVPVSLHIQNAAAASACGIMDALDPSSVGTTPQVASNFSIQPCPPRKLSVKAMAVGGSSDGLEFAGYDAKGDYITETVYVSSTGSAVNYTNNAFAVISNITADGASHTSTDVDIGYTDDFGLSYPIASSGDVLYIAKDGVQATTSPLSTTDTTYDCISFTPNTDSEYEIVWLTEFQAA